MGANQRLRNDPACAWVESSTLPTRPLHRESPRAIEPSRPKQERVASTWFRSTVSALCYSILYERCKPLTTDSEFPHNRAALFVLAQQGRMPEYLRLPFAAVTLAFGASSVLRHGKFFHSLPHASRWRQIEAWRSASLGPCRDLIRFYESFVIFHWHSTRPNTCLVVSHEDRGRPLNEP